MLHLFLNFHFLGPVRVNQESVSYKVKKNLNKLPGGVTMIVVQFGNTYE